MSRCAPHGEGLCLAYPLRTEHYAKEQVRDHGRLPRTTKQQGERQNHEDDFDEGRREWDRVH